MNVTATGLCGVAFFLATGLALVDLVPGLSRRSLPGRVGYAYVLGIAWTAGGMYLLSHAFGMTLRRGTILPIAVVPMLLAVARRIGTRATRRTSFSEGSSPSSPSKQKSPVVLSLVVLSLFSFLLPAFVTVGVFSHAVTDPVTDWDGRMTWVTQARFIREERTVDAKVLTEKQWYVTNPRYPLLMPLAQVAVQEIFSTSDDTRLIRPLYAAFFPVFLLILYDAASQLADRTAGSLMILAASGVPMLTFENFGGANGCCSDFPLACFFGAGLFLLLSRRLGVKEGAAAGLLLAAAVLTKNEGLALAGAVLFVTAIRPVRMWRASGKIGALAAWASAAAVVLASMALVLSWQSGIPSRYQANFGAILHEPSAWARVPNNIPVSLSRVAATVTDTSKWGFFWALVPVVAILGGRRALRRPAGGKLVLASAVPLAIGFAASLVFWDTKWLAETTFSRFLVQASLPFFCVLAMGLAGSRSNLRSILALSAVSAFLVVSIPTALNDSWGILSEAWRLRGEDAHAACRRIYGDAYWSAIEAIRWTIPTRDSYLLAWLGGAGADVFTRFDLAPRRAVFLGRLRPGQPDFVIPARPVSSSPWTVVARGTGQTPRLVETDVFFDELASYERFREDDQLPCNVEVPAEGERVREPVVLRGWCQEIGGRPCESVRIFLDGEERKPDRFERYPRPDVEAVVKGIGNCERAGFRADFAFRREDTGEHTAIVFFLTGDGRYRRMGPLRFVVIPRAEPR